MPGRSVALVEASAKIELLGRLQLCSKNGSSDFAGFCFGSFSRNSLESVFANSDDYLNTFMGC